MTTRRGFLGLLGSAASAFALDPERALWVPGAKTISIPAPQLLVMKVGPLDLAHCQCFEFTYSTEELLFTFNPELLFDAMAELPKIGEPITIRRPQLTPARM